MSQEPDQLAGNLLADNLPVYLKGAEADSSPAQPTASEGGRVATGTPTTIEPEAAQETPGVNPPSNLPSQEEVRKESIPLSSLGIPIEGFFNPDQEIEVYKPAKKKNGESRGKAEASEPEILNLRDAYLSALRVIVDRLEEFSQTHPGALPREFGDFLSRYPKEEAARRQFFDPGNKSAGRNWQLATAIMERYSLLLAISLSRAVILKVVREGKQVTAPQKPPERILIEEGGRASLPKLVWERMRDIWKWLDQNGIVDIIYLDFGPFLRRLCGAIKGLYEASDERSTELALRNLQDLQRQYDCLPYDRYKNLLDFLNPRTTADPENPKFLPSVVRNHTAFLLRITQYLRGFYRAAGARDPLQASPWEIFILHGDDGDGGSLESLDMGAGTRLEADVVRRMRELLEGGGYRVDSAAGRARLYSDAQKDVIIQFLAEEPAQCLLEKVLGTAHRYSPGETALLRQEAQKVRIGKPVTQDEVDAKIKERVVAEEKMKMAEKDKAFIQGDPEEKLADLAQEIMDTRRRIEQIERSDLVAARKHLTDTQAATTKKDDPRVASAERVVDNLEKELQEARQRITRLSAEFRKVHDRLRRILIESGQNIPPNLGAGEVFSRNKAAVCDYVIRAAAKAEAAFRKARAEQEEAETALKEGRALKPDKKTADRLEMVCRLGDEEHYNRLMIAILSGQVTIDGEKRSLETIRDWPTFLQVLFGDMTIEQFSLAQEILPQEELICALAGRLGITTFAEVGATVDTSGRITNAEVVLRNLLGRVLTGSENAVRFFSYVMSNVLHYYFRTHVLGDKTAERFTKIKKGDLWP